MDNSLPQHTLDTQRPARLLAGLRVVDSILSWLVGFIRLTEEEQKDAGIYLGD